MGLTLCQQNAQCNDVYLSDYLSQRLSQLLSQRLLACLLVKREEGKRQGARAELRFLSLFQPYHRLTVEALHRIL